MNTARWEVEHEPTSRSDLQVSLGPVGTRALICQRTAHSYQCELLGQATHGALHQSGALECAEHSCRGESGHVSFRGFSYIEMRPSDLRERQSGRDPLELHLRVARRRVLKWSQS